MLKKIFAASVLSCFCLSTSYAFTLTSQAVKPFAFLNSAQVCSDQNGANVSPDFSWSDIPENTRALVLFAHDPDAPHMSGFVHWVVYIDNPQVQALNQGQASSPKEGIYFGLNGLDKNAYMGACPPVGSGTHRYQFTLYALNTQLDAKNIIHLHQNEIVNLIADKIIDQAVLTGFYKNKNSF